MSNEQPTPRRIRQRALSEFCARLERDVATSERGIARQRAGLVDRAMIEFASLNPRGDVHAFCDRYRAMLSKHRV